MAVAKILVIEDEPDIVEVITYNLEREGYEVCSARDGEEGLPDPPGEPSSFLLDLMLPDRRTELCRTLRSDPATLDPDHHADREGDESDVVLGSASARRLRQKPFSPKELSPA
jgi:DNA-binding response OmpR family regulator